MQQGTFIPGDEQSRRRSGEEPALESRRFHDLLRSEALLQVEAEREGLLVVPELALDVAREAPARQEVTLLRRAHAVLRQVVVVGREPVEAVLRERREAFTHVWSLRGEPEARSAIVATLWPELGEATLDVLERLYPGARTR